MTNLYSGQLKLHHRQNNKRVKVMHLTGKTSRKKRKFLYHNPILVVYKEKESYMCKKMTKGV